MESRNMRGGLESWRCGLVARLLCCLVACAASLVVLMAPAHAQAEYVTKSLGVKIDGLGQVVSLYDAVRGKEYLASDQPAPLVAVKTGDMFEQPSLSVVAEDPKLITLRYEQSGVSIDVKVVEKDTHITFEIVRAEPVDTVALIVWGPYPTAIDKTVGEVIGVVRDGDYAVGIQALNVKTLGGYPENAEGLDNSRGNAAKQMPWGSVLQAYCMDRTKPRNVDAWNGSFPNMPVPPIPGETVVGSKIALFGCAEADTLDTIGKIEVAEGLPHPLIDGVWAKVSPEKGRSYLIADFSEESIDEMLGYVKRADLMTLYHGGPFESWGHYEFSAKFFPNGDKGMRECVEKAKARGIRLGVHTLTNFIQPSDAYVTPTPDPRLALTGSSDLAGDIGAEATEIPVVSPEYFANEKANWMHTVMIDQELIRCRAVSEEEPWMLLDCQRGAFGTQAGPHAQGARVGKLSDHAYKVFFPNLELQREIAVNLAKRFNNTGLEQMDFDGHEGCLASGQGNYAVELFAKDFYDNLDHTVLNGTSNSAHYYWHINSYCNWGEPWYGGFRDSMQEYRIQNQALFERNFMPGMLGWYMLAKSTSLSDMEWMLARAAGFNAGFALATNQEALRENANTEIILDAIREWEHARRNGAFSPEQRERMKIATNEFHLEKTGDGEWNLYSFRNSEEFTHEQTILQPGQPTSAQWEMVNAGGEQGLCFKLQAVGEAGLIANPTIEVDNYATVVVPVRLKAGQTLVCEGSQAIRVLDAKGNVINVVQADKAPARISPGRHDIAFDCEFDGSPSPKAVLTIRTMDKPEAVRIP